MSLRLRESDYNMHHASWFDNIKDIFESKLTCFITNPRFEGTDITLLFNVSDFDRFYSKELIFIARSFQYFLFEKFPKFKYSHAVLESSTDSFIIEIENFGTNNINLVHQFFKDEITRLVIKMLGKYNVKPESIMIKNYWKRSKYQRDQKRSINIFIDGFWLKLANVNSNFIKNIIRDLLFEYNIRNYNRLELIEEIKDKIYRYALRK